MKIHGEGSHSSARRKGRQLLMSDCSLWNYGDTQFCCLNHQPVLRAGLEINVSANVIAVSMRSKWEKVGSKRRQTFNASHFCLLLKMVLGV